MYSDVKSVRILVALLKAYGIQDAVLSSGTCSIPVLHSMETDAFFNCYSDIDERSAVYLAMGIAQVKKTPVAVVCTSGTAVCNYLPGVREAHKNGVPLVIITCDKDPYSTGHMTIQKINQENAFGKNCNCSVTLPVIKDKTDEWAVRMMISQTLLNVSHHGAGPVHINIYTDGDKKTFNTPSLPNVVKIERIGYFQLADHLNAYKDCLHTHKRILVVCGESAFWSERDVQALEQFCSVYGAALIGEPVANVGSLQCLDTYRLTEQLMMDRFRSELAPDLVISMGGNFASYEIKALLKSLKVKHWWIDPSGKVVDSWRSIHTVFEMTPYAFFSTLSQNMTSIKANLYADKWKCEYEKIILPDMPYSSFSIVKKISAYFSQLTVLHLGILNSTRLGLLMQVPCHVRTYSNLGALGIDGSLSTFLGQASEVKDGNCLCIIGDLSFIYDINAVYESQHSKNTKIVLLNNGGGSEFHLNTGIQTIPMLDDYISAGHSSIVGSWAEQNGFSYYTIRCEDQADSVIAKFFECPNAAILEVITDIEYDSQVIKSMYELNGYRPAINRRNAKLKKLCVKAFGVEKAQKLAKMAKVWAEK